MNITTSDKIEAASIMSEEQLANLRKILGSCNVNYLFGAGVNGDGFPCFNRFNRTIEAIQEAGLSGDGIEIAMHECSDEELRGLIMKAFVDEFNSYKEYQLNNPSLVNLSNLLIETQALVARAENRHPESKRVNVFTLNYDRIVEELLEQEEIFHCMLKDNSPRTQLPFEIVGYNTRTKAFIPTFAVYKLHGTVDADRALHADNIVFPGQDKLGNVLSDFYETLFAMKGELLKRNSVLFVLGYSWSDDHVNGVIRDAIANGLTVFNLQYSSECNLPEDLFGVVQSIPPFDPENPQDTTKTLSIILQAAMK